MCLFRAIVWDPCEKKDIDWLACIQQQAAGFISKDYRFTEEGCVGKTLLVLKLPPLQEHRKQQTPNSL